MIPLNCFTEFVTNRTSIVDGDQLKLVTSDSLFYQITSLRPKNITGIPSKALIRYSFTEMMIRLSVKKYYDTGMCKSESEAVEKMLEDHLVPHWDEVNPGDWCTMRYWNEKCDNLILSHMHLFRELYRNYSGRTRRGGYKATMTVDEFVKMFEDAALTGDQFSLREGGIILNQSLETVITEVGSNKQNECEFIEFLEAFFRVAERLSFPPSIRVERDADGTFEYDHQDPEFTDQTLRDKTLNILPQMLRQCCSKMFQKYWVWPTRNIKYDLFITVEEALKERQLKLEVQTHYDKATELLKQTEGKFNLSGLLSSKESTKSIISERQRRGSILEVNSPLSAELMRAESPYRRVRKHVSANKLI